MASLPTRCNILHAETQRAQKNMAVICKKGESVHRWSWADLLGRFRVALGYARLGPRALAVEHGVHSAEFEAGHKLCIIVLRCATGCCRSV